MKRNISLVPMVLLMLAGSAVQAEEASPPPAAVVPAAAPAAAPKPPVPAATPAAVAKPAPAEKEKPAAVQPPAGVPAGSPNGVAEFTRSGDMPASRDTKIAVEQSAASNGMAGYLWPVFSFAMLIAGFVAGYAWRHHVSRHKLGGMTVRIGTWRGTP